MSHSGFEGFTTVLLSQNNIFNFVTIQYSIIITIQLFCKTSNVSPQHFQNTIFLHYNIIKLKLCYNTQHCYHIDIIHSTRHNDYNPTILYYYVLSLCNMKSLHGNDHITIQLYHSLTLL